MHRPIYWMLVSNARNLSIKSLSPKSNVLWNVSIGATSNSSDILKLHVNVNNSVRHIHEHRWISTCCKSCVAFSSLIYLEINLFDSSYRWGANRLTFLPFACFKTESNLFRIDFASNVEFWLTSSTRTSLLDAWYVFGCGSTATSFPDMTCEYFVFLHLNNSFSTLKFGN